MSWWSVSTACRSWSWWMNGELVLNVLHCLNLSLLWCWSVLWLWDPANPAMVFLLPGSPFMGKKAKWRKARGSLRPETKWQINCRWKVFLRKLTSNGLSRARTALLLRTIHYSKSVCEVHSFIRRRNKYKLYWSDLALILFNIKNLHTHIHTCREILHAALKRCFSK